MPEQCGKRKDWRMKIAVASDEKTHLTDFVIEDLKERGHDVMLYGPLANVEISPGLPVLSNNQDLKTGWFSVTFSVQKNATFPSENLTVLSSSKMLDRVRI